MTDIGHNSGTHGPLTPKAFVEWARALLVRSDLSGTNKLVAMKIAIDAGRDWSSEVTTAELMKSASVSDKVTIYKSVKKLDELGIISKAPVRRGFANRFSVIPQNVVDAIIEEFGVVRSSRTTRYDQTRLVESIEPVRSDHTTAAGTSEVGGHQYDATSAVEPYHPKFSPAPARAVDNNIIYNNNKHLEKYNPTQPDTKIAACASETVDFAALSDKLLSACNGALDNPVNCQGLANLATPIMWLDNGCDLDRDIIPTLQAFGKTAHGKRIRTWSYFTAAITQARDTRLAGLPSRASSAATPDQDKQLRQIDAIVRGGR